MSTAVAEGPVKDIGKWINVVPDSIARSAARRARSAAEAYGELSSSMSEATAALRRLRGSDHRLMRDVGIALIAIPDPIMATDAAGVALVLLSRILSRAGIEDLVKEASRLGI